jgi:hypothetical protein
MFLLYHSEGCNSCGGLFRKCYVNDLHTTTCSGMLGHRNIAVIAYLYDRHWQAQACRRQGDPPLILRVCAVVPEPPHNPRTLSIVRGEPRGEPLRFPGAARVPSSLSSTYRDDSRQPSILTRSNGWVCGTVLAPCYR